MSGEHQATSVSILGLTTIPDEPTPVPVVITPVLPSDLEKKTQKYAQSSAKFKTTEEVNAAAQVEVDAEKNRLRHSGSFDRMVGNLLELSETNTKLTSSVQELVKSNVELSKMVQRLIRICYIVLFNQLFLALVMTYVVIMMSLAKGGH